MVVSALGGEFPEVWLLCGRRITLLHLSKATKGRLGYAFGYTAILDSLVVGEEKRVHFLATESQHFASGGERSERARDIESKPTVDVGIISRGRALFGSWPERVVPVLVPRGVLEYIMLDP